MSESQQYTIKSFVCSRIIKINYFYFFPIKGTCRFPMKKKNDRCESELPLFVVQVSWNFNQSVYDDLRYLAPGLRGCS